MKALAAILIFCTLATQSKAGGAYRNYLLSKVYNISKITPSHVNESTSLLSSAAYIPRFETPKGAIFCRMEDKVTKATKVWLKLGVQ